MRVDFRGRADGLRVVSVGLSALGLLDSLYLTWVKLADATAACSNFGDCETVNQSRYSEVGGIPIALLGALAYLTIVALLAVGWRLPKVDHVTRLAIFGLALTGTFYSAYLTYLEVAVLRAICPFCVLSAISITAILVLSVIRLREEDADG